MTPDAERAAIALYDRFTHEGLDRRSFMAALTRLAGGAAAAGAFLSSVACSAAAVPQIAADDARLRTDTHDFRFDDRFIRCYRAARHDVVRDERRFVRRQAPIVMVVHENRGLNEHIRDVARRLAVAGYRAIAPDFLSLDGGATPPDEDRARTAIGALDMARTVDTGAALIRLLHAPQHVVRPFETRPNAIGLVGFCWGGGMVDRLAIAAGPALAAGVSFYGPAPDPSEAAKVDAAMLILMAGLDDRVNATARPWAEALRAAGKSVETATYPGVDHAFHNDTSAARYNQAAALAAWAATLDFFRRHLTAPA